MINWFYNSINSFDGIDRFLMHIQPYYQTILGLHIIVSVVFAIILFILFKRHKLNYKFAVFIFWIIESIYVFNKASLWCCDPLELKFFFPKVALILWLALSPLGLLTLFLL